MISSVNLPVSADGPGSEECTGICFNGLTTMPSAAIFPTEELGKEEGEMRLKEC